MTLAFFDSNVLVYALGADRKAELARSRLDEGGRISVQSLNEFANVARRKAKLDWTEIGELSRALQYRFAPVLPVTEALHRESLRLSDRYQFAFYDALIVAAALETGCDTLYSEDMHAGLVIDGRLTITNPFA